MPLILTRPQLSCVCCADAGAVQMLQEFYDALDIVGLFVLHFRLVLVSLMSLLQGSMVLTTIDSAGLAFIVLHFLSLSVFVRIHCC